MLNTERNNQWPLLPVEMFILIGSFWLSGLFILSIIFTQHDTEAVDQLNMYMFISLGVGSLLGGYASDYIGRFIVFKAFSALLGISSIVILLDSWVGYVIAAGCIGLLNNLAFVIVMEMFPEKKEKYTVYLLMGWASSQITLGILFKIIDDVLVFYLILFVLGMIFCLSVFLYMDEPAPPDNQAEDDMQNNKDLRGQLIEGSSSKSSNQSSPWYKRILPYSYKPLIGGCVLMFVMQMFYYRTQFTLDKFGISLELNTIVVGITQLLADIIFTKLVDRAPRKFFLRLFLLFLMGLFILLVIFQGKIVQTVVQGIMRLFDASIMIVLGVYLPELFQADQRGKGTNYIMSFGVLGSALNAIILNNFAFWQLIFFLAAAFASTFLFKETYIKRSSSSQEERR